MKQSVDEPILKESYPIKFPENLELEWMIIYERYYQWTINVRNSNFFFSFLLVNEVSKVDSYCNSLDINALIGITYVLLVYIIFIKKKVTLWSHCMSSLKSLVEDKLRKRERVSLGGNGND